LSALHEDSNWPRASGWLSGSKEGRTLGTLGVLGAGLNRSITPGRCDLAPTAVREALRRLSTYDFDHDVDVRRIEARDFGDVRLARDYETSLGNVRKALEAALDLAGAVVLLGGDNGVTLPGVQALGPLGHVGLVTLDAHLDLRETHDGPMNGNPIRGLLEAGLPGEHVVQIGLQSFANSAAYAQVARKHGRTTIPASAVHGQGIDAVVARAFALIPTHVSAVYVDLDLDVMDRSFAPACPGARPGGLLPWQVRRFAYLAGGYPKTKVMDLVELDPERDVGDCTALTAAVCLLEFASGMLSRGSTLIS
jgi:formiminoglutamase